MTVSNAGYLKGFYDATKALGKKTINSDFTFEIEGFERNRPAKPSTQPRKTRTWCALKLSGHQF